MMISNAPIQHPIPMLEKALSFQASRPWVQWFGDVRSSVKTLQTHVEGVFNVKNYGAVGGDVIRDTAGVQAAINTAIISTGSGVVFFPPGTYLCSNLTIPDLGGNRKVSIVFRGCGAPDLLYDGNTDPAEVPGSILKCSVADSSHFITHTLSGVNSSLTTLNLEDLQIVGAGTGSGDGLRISGDHTYSRIVRVNFRNVGVRGFTSGNGVYLNYCENGSAYNLTVNRCNRGLYLANASNANNFYNLVAQYNVTNAVYITDCLSLGFLGGLIQANPKNGIYINGADELLFANVHFESNNTATGNTYRAFHVQGTSGLYNSRINLLGCRFASSYDDIYLQGVADGNVSYVMILGCRRVAEGTSLTIADADCYYTHILPSLGGTISDSGTQTARYDLLALTQPVLATGTGKTVDEVITELQNLGLVKQS